MKLTPKQKAFADEYILTGNVTQSATKAGYKKPNVQGSQNLAKLSIQEYIKDKNKSLESAKIADMEEVKQFWSNLLRDNESDPKDRLKASELIAKTNGAFIDKVQHSGTISNEVVIEIGVAEDD